MARVSAQAEIMPSRGRGRGIAPRPRRGAILTVLLLLLYALPVTAAAGPCELPTGLVHNGGYALADSPCGHRTSETFVPASILKLVTALAVLHELGPEYRCRTRFALDSNDNLLIEGRGDPLLTSEELALVLAQLRRRGLRRINDLVLDDRFFALEGPTPGGEGSLNPYDAPNGALAANFNTLHVLVGVDRQVRSAEAQTPTIPLMRELGARLPPGQHRVNLGAALFHGDDASGPRHLGEVLRALQQEAGIAGEGTIRLGSAGEIRLEYLHSSSQPLREVVRNCLAYSNNFVANQLLLLLGLELYGPPANWDKGRRALHQVLDKLIGEELAATMHIVDGSGLSRNNRVSPAAMLAVLDALRPHAGLLPELDEDLIKSGTMTGVYSYAGYLGTAKQSFVLMLNQERNNRERLLALMRRWAAGPRRH